MAIILAFPQTVAMAQPGNTAPTAAFDYVPTAPRVGQAVQFTDRSSDPDGTIEARSWSFGDGATSRDQNPSHIYRMSGEYTVSLTVVDDDGASDTLTQAITVAETANGENQPPTAAFTVLPPPPQGSLTVNFMDLSSDDGAIAAWLWSFGDGATSSNQNPSHTFPESGSYTVSLTVFDDDGASGTTTQTLVVSGPSTGENAPPTAAFTTMPSPPNGNLTVLFVDLSTDADGTIVAWSWSFGDGESSEEISPTHPYTSSGTYTVSLTVTDDDGASASVSHDVSVGADTGNGSVASFSYRPTTPKVGQTVQFTDTSMSGENLIEAWQWSFGDGATSTAQHPTHAFAAAATYTVTLTVTDSQGATNTASRPIAVVAASAPEVALTAGPNPADYLGAAFFYQWPQGSTKAELIIFDVTGRIVFRADLPVGSTRFPEVGTWTLVDQDGDSLANGPYYVVLIADGKLNEKMTLIIQR